MSEKEEEFKDDDGLILNMYRGEVNHAFNLLNARKNNITAVGGVIRSETPLRVIPPPPVRSFVWTFHGLPSPASPPDAFFRAHSPPRSRERVSFDGSCRVHFSGLRSPTQISSAGGDILRCSDHEEKESLT